MKKQKNIVAAATAFCLALLFSTADPSTALAGPASLQYFVEAGKVPPGIAERAERGETVEVLVIVEASDIRDTAKSMRESAGLRNDNRLIIAEKARQYGLRKKLILAGLAGPDFSVLHDYETLPVLHLNVNERALEALPAMPEVSHIAENRQSIPHLTESLPLIGAPDAHTSGATGSGTSVAVLDTGVYYDEPAFGDCSGGPGTGSCKIEVYQCFAFGGCLPDQSHGTNVSGIVVGVAPDTSILALRVFRASGYAYDSDILDALDWVLANKDTYNIVAVNMSLGGDRFFAPCESESLAVAVTDLKAAGIAASISSGNDGFTDSISYPACAPDAISVGAVYDEDFTGYNIIWSVCTDEEPPPDQVTCFSNSASFLTLLAPGAIINAAGYTMAGTSQAAPHVAGAIAVLKGNDSSLTVDRVRAALEGSGVPVSDARNSITKPRVAVYDALNCNPPVRVAALYYDTLQSAYDAAPDGGTVEVQSVGFFESLTLDRSGTYTLQGGYDCDFAAGAEPAVINGSAAISGGTVIFDNIVIQ